MTEPYFPFNKTSVEDFDIGTDTDCMIRVGFCNGELKPGTTYRVKIRAYTARDKFADTYFSHPITTGEHLQDVWKLNTSLALVIYMLVACTIIAMNLSL